MMSQTRIGLCLLAALLLSPIAVSASDHADPVILTNVDVGITGLFVFPDGEDMIVILTLRRGMQDETAFDLESFEFTVSMDLDSLVSYQVDENNARYGGMVRQPTKIEADVTIRYRLNNDASIAYGFPVIEPMGNGDTTTVTGVYDDPFIFPRFAKTNVIAMVTRIPFAAFRDNPDDDFLIWATTTTKGLFGGTKQIDHVGRSARSQLGRFDFLNKRHPSEHVAAIEGMLKLFEKVQGPIAHGMKHIPEKASAGHRRCASRARRRVRVCFA